MQDMRCDIVKPLTRITNKPMTTVNSDSLRLEWKATFSSDEPKERILWIKTDMYDLLVEFRSAEAIDKMQDFMDKICSAG